MSTRLSGEQPPTPEEPNRLLEWLTRMVININGMMNTHEEDALGIFCFAAYGGLAYENPQDAFTLDATWRTITAFDALSIVDSRYVTASIVNSSISWDYEGVYAISVSINFTHNSDNAGRIVLARIFDITDNVAIGNSIAIGVARNAEATNFSIVVPVDLSGAPVGNELVLQLSTADIFSATEFTALAYSTWSIGEWRGTLEAIR